MVPGKRVVCLLQMKIEEAGAGSDSECLVVLGGVDASEALNEKDFFYDWVLSHYLAPAANTENVIICGFSIIPHNGHYRAYSFLTGQHFHIQVPSSSHLALPQWAKQHAKRPLCLN